MRNCMACSRHKPFCGNVRALWILPPIHNIELIELRENLLRGQGKNADLFAGDLLQHADPLLRAKYLALMDAVLHPPLQRLKR